MVGPARAETFDEAGYLEANPDVAAAVSAGHFESGRQHFERFGVGERRLMALTGAREAIETRRLAKMKRVKPLLDLSLAHKRNGAKYDFLTPALREQAGISETSAVSANPYDEHVTALIEENAEGLLLDCGAGSRPVYFDNVVNYEIVDYLTTDVIGVGERLPFKSDVFDGVISIAVLEHVRDPFGCAAELVRVLKPGGRLVCCVPFLQPEHGYPHHYYNMTRLGLRRLFEDGLRIEDQRVVLSTLPVWSLTWFLRSWAAGLEGAARAAFLDLKVGELVGDPSALLDRAWVTGLSGEKNFELASATMLFGRKPG